MKLCSGHYYHQAMPALGFEALFNNVGGNFNNTV